MSRLILKDFVPNFKIIHHTGQIYPTVLCTRTWGLPKCLKMAVTEIGHVNGYFRSCLIFCSKSSNPWRACSSSSKTHLSSSANIHYLYKTEIRFI